MRAAFLNAALTSQIKQLQAKNKQLRNLLDQARPLPFSVECVSHDDALVSLCTGFPSFFRFLGPDVEHLQMWGVKTKFQEKR